MPTMLSLSHQTIFADDTYSRPYLVTYVNSSFFAFLLVPLLIRYLLTSNGPWQAIFHNREEFVGYAPLVDGSDHVSGARRSHDEPLMRNGYATGAPEDGSPRFSTRLRKENARTSVEDRLDFRETAWLSLEFSILWVTSRSYIFVATGQADFDSSSLCVSPNWIFLAHR